VPTIFTANGYRFHFHAAEGSPREPMHVHIDKAGAKAKFWLEPEIRLSVARGFSSKQFWEIETRSSSPVQIASRRLGMVTFVREPQATRAWCDEDDLWVELDDGRKIATPLAYFPRLLHISDAQRCRVELSARGTALHWPEVDEDISVETLVLGPGDRPEIEFLRRD
jgi:Protein of unknown function (DUF2442)/Domain of unknown function (DUF4160)